jgi:3-isopropylmalate/(R)-2-methylmalate dehydratase large subunit
VDSVRPGDLITAKVDLAMGNDLSTISAIGQFEKVGAKTVWDPDRIAIVMSHFVPSKDIATAELTKKIRAWIGAQGIGNYFEVGQGGIEHVVLPERGLVRPGTLIVGGDSHTCTYGALGAFGTGLGATDLAAVFITGEVWLKVPETLPFEFRGEPDPWVGAKDLILFAISKVGVDGALYRAVEYRGDPVHALGMSGRLTLANMAVEMGAKNGIVHVDDVTRSYLEARGVSGGYETFFTDEGAQTLPAIDCDISGMGPVVAFPPSPDLGRPIEEARGIKVDQVVIGSCTNGRLEDLEIAAAILRGRKVRPGVRLIVFPGSQSVYLEALQAGLVEALVEAGAAVSTPTCGACLGGHMGVLAGGEVCLSTTNRNYAGRMGHREAQIYLASPAVAAATAITGEITHPKEVANR